jgi:hypothetical protein
MCFVLEAEGLTNISAELGKGKTPTTFFLNKVNLLLEKPNYQVKKW